MTLRRIRRAVTLVVVLGICILRYWLKRLRGPVTLERRALWLHECSRLVLRCVGVACTVEGQPPSCGLVVSNHLSYLDILVFSAAMPCFFISKAEVSGWFFFSSAARTGGTIFLDRSSMASARTVAEQIDARLRLPIPVPVLLFPEGTSTDGRQVLRFHTRLIDPATKAGAPITAAAIRYVIEGGIEEREFCWYGDEGFLPHLWKAMGFGGVSARLYFGEPRIYPDRRAAAGQTYAEIVAWRGASSPAVLCAKQ